MASKKAVVLGFIVLIVVFGLFVFLDDSAKTLHEATGLVVSAESFPVYLETHPVVDALPKDAAVAITIGGQAYGVEGHTVSTDTVIADPDISVNLPAGYEARIGQVGLCQGLREAVASNSLQIEHSVSTMTLFFKYRKLLKYRECLE